MGLISDLKSNDKKGLFNSNDTVINYSTGLLPLDYANGYWQEIHKPDGTVEHEAVLGIRGGSFISIIAPSGCGKAQPDNTMIPTPNGQTRLDQLQIGDEVFNIHGKPVKIIGIFPQGNMDVYEIIFNDGRKTKCSANHLWNVKTSNGKKYITKELQELLNNYKEEDNNIHNYRIPACPKLHYNAQSIPIDPWTLGTFIGNGCLGEEYLTISCETDEIPNKIAKRYGIKVFKESNYNFNYTFYTESGKHIKTEDFFQSLPEMIKSSSATKKIPKIYLYNSVNIRSDLLTGLLDTDGSISKKKFQISYNTISSQLKDDIVQLSRSLGYRAYVTEDTRDKYSTGVCYRIGISTKDNEKPNLFTCNKKLNRAIDAVSTYSTRVDYDTLIITDIKLVGNTSQRCIYIDDPDHLYITEGFVPTHNTTLADQMGYNIIKNFDDGLLYHIDAERTALRQRLIEVTGADINDERIVIKKENTSIEDVLEMITKICEAKEADGESYKYEAPLHRYDGSSFKVYVPTVVIVDSVVSFTSKEYSVDDLGSNMDGARRAKALTRFINNCLDRMEHYNITVILISHIRQKVETNPYATTPPGIMMLKPGESVPGGMTMQYMCQNFFRISMTGSKSNAYSIEDTGFVGFKASIQVAKSKTNCVGTSIPVAFNSAHGFDPIFSLYEYASSIGLIQGKNPHLYFQGLDTMKFSRKDFIRKFMEEKEFRDAVFAILKPNLEALLGSKEVTDDDRQRYGDLFPDSDKISDNKMKKIPVKAKLK